MALHGMKVSGTLNCLAGRDIEMPNSFDLLTGWLFFTLEDELPEPNYRLFIATKGADEFALTYNNLEDGVNFPSTKSLSDDLMLCEHFGCRFEQLDIKHLSFQMIQFWTAMIRYCQKNFENSSEHSANSISQNLEAIEAVKANSPSISATPNATNRSPSETNVRIPHAHLHLQNEHTSNRNLFRFARHISTVPSRPLEPGFFSNAKRLAETEARSCS